MKKLIFGVFAHPDDEAFGPAGTLLQETDAGAELHLVLLTAGENGTNNANHDDLGAVRLEEWRRSGELLGATSQDFWGYRDGQLTNTDMIEISNRLAKYIEEKADQADEIELLSYEFGGITGHIDHIVAARAAAETFCRLQQDDSRFTRLRLFCLPKQLRPQHDASWIYAEAGCDESSVDEIIHARPLRQRIEAIMSTHASQVTDADHVKNLLGDQLGMNWFQVIK